MDSTRLRPLVLPLLVLGAALTLFLINLGHPDRIYFDEVYYVNDAREILANGVEDGFVVHPPLGKLIIATGIELFGDRSFGWRVMGAVAGALTVMLAFLIARRLFRSNGPALVAAALLATDGLFFAQARISMLDIHLAFFVALGAWLLLVDHDRTTSRDTDPRPGPRLEIDGRRVPARNTLPRRSHWARNLAGIAFGLAIATKWSGLFALGGAGLLTVGWELAHRQRVAGFMLRQWARGAGSVTVGLVLLPAAAYAASWTPWFLNFEHSYEGAKVCADQDPCEVEFDEKVSALVSFHERIWRFHDELEVEHNYRARAYTWPVMARPVVYYWESCSAARASGIPKTEDDGTVVEPEPCVVAQGDAGEILAVGNPALWYPFIGAAALVVAGLVRRDRRAAYVAVFYGAQFVPWLLQTRPLFFFYMAPNVLFMALGIGYAVTVLNERIRIRVTAIGAIAGAGAGWLAGTLLGESLALGTPVWPWVGMGMGWLYGAAIGGAVDHRAERRGGAPLFVPRRGVWVGAIVTLAAMVLFGFFAPVWTGVALDRDHVELRWWQRGWI